MIHETRPRDSLYWLKLLADHHDSLVVNGIAHGALKEMAALKDERDRYRAALEGVSRISEGSSAWNAVEWAIWDRARAALEEPK